MVEHLEHGPGFGIAVRDGAEFVTPRIWHNPRGVGQDGFHRFGDVIGEIRSNAGSETDRDRNVVFDCL